MENKQYGWWNKFRKSVNKLMIWQKFKKEFIVKYWISIICENCLKKIMVEIKEILKDCEIFDDLTVIF